MTNEANEPEGTARSVGQVLDFSSGLSQKEPILRRISARQVSALNKESSG